MDPVRAQVSNTTRGTRSENPFSAILGSWMGRRDAVWNTQLGLEAHQAKNNLNREHQKNLGEDAIGEAGRWKELGVEQWERTSHGGQSGRFPKPVAPAQPSAKGKGKTKPEGGSNPADNLQDVDLGENPAAKPTAGKNPAKPRKQRQPSGVPNFADLDAGTLAGGVTPKEASELNPAWAKARGINQLDIPDQVAPVFRTESNVPQPAEKPKTKRWNTPTAQD